LIHGLFGSLENLNMVAKSLAKNYRVLSIDAPNHGDSFHRDNMDYSLIALDVVNLLDHLTIESINILGHSMGGKIAMQVALEYPSRVKKLIVADIAPIAYPPHHSDIISGLQSIDLSLINHRRDADKQLANSVDNLSVRQFLLRSLSLNKEEQWAFKYNLDFIASCYPQIMKANLLPSNASPFTGKTLFIKGSESTYILPEHKPAIAALLPNSKAKIIQGAGHWLHAEKSIAFNKIVFDFLK
jgi:esterase